MVPVAHVCHDVLQHSCAQHAWVHCSRRRARASIVRALQLRMWRRACATLARAWHAHCGPKERAFAYELACFNACAESALIACVVVRAFQTARVHECALVPNVGTVRVLKYDIVHVRRIARILALIAHPLQGVLCIVALERACNCIFGPTG